MTIQVNETNILLYNSCNLEKIVCENLFKCYFLIHNNTNNEMLRIINDYYNTLINSLCNVCMKRVGKDYLCCLECGCWYLIYYFCSIHKKCSWGMLKCKRPEFYWYCHICICTKSLKITPDVNNNVYLFVF